MATIEELEKKFNELKQKQKEELAQAKANLARKKAAAAEAMRKQDTHLKCIIGGYVIGKMKESKNIAALEKLLETNLSSRDKQLIEELKKVILAMPPTDTAGKAK